MATVIDSFLVGIGFQPDTQGARVAQNSLNSIRSAALQLGAAVGTGLGFNQLTFGFANAADEAGKFSENIGVSVSDLDRLRFAIIREGGNINELRGELSNLDQFVAGLMVGDVGFLAAAEAAGIQTEAIIKSSNAFESYLAIADQFSQLSRQQRVNAAQALGIGPASFRLLSRGRQGIEDYLQEADRFGTRTAEHSRVAAEFNDSLKRLRRSFRGVGDTLSVNFLPFLTLSSNRMADFVANNRDFIDSGVEQTADRLGEGISALSASIAALTTGAGAAGLGAILSRLGLGGAGAAVSGVGATAAAAGGIGLAGVGGFTLGSFLADILPQENLDNVGRSIRRIQALLGDEESARLLQSEARFNRMQAEESRNVNITFNPQQSDIGTIRRIVNQELNTTMTQVQQNMITSDDG